MNLNTKKQSGLWEIVKYNLFAVGVFAHIVLLLAIGWLLFNLSIPARLPNEYSLTPVWFNLKNLSLIDPKGKKIIPDYVDNVAWCDDIVYGVHYTKNTFLTNSTFQKRLFIYVGAQQHLYYEDVDAQLYHEQFLKYNIPAWPAMHIHYFNLTSRKGDAPRESCPGREQPAH